MLLRLLALVSALTLWLAPSSQAALLVGSPAPIAPATENASTAFLEDGSEPRIGLLCHNDPVNYQDPTGLGKIGFFIRAGRFVWKKVGKEQAERALKNHVDVKIEGPGASKEGRNLARKEFGDRTERHDAHRQGWLPHYQHRNGGGPHVFYKALSVLTAVNLLGDNAFGNTIDFFNPASDVKDVIDLMDEIPQRQIEPPRSRLQIELAP